MYVCTVMDVNLRLCNLLNLFYCTVSLRGLWNCGEPLDNTTIFNYGQKKVFAP